MTLTPIFNAWQRGAWIGRVGHTGEGVERTARGGLNGMPTAREDNQNNNRAQRRNMWGRRVVLSQVKCRVTAASAGLVLVLLAGCEAELRLEGVEATSAKPIHRTDQFLAIERAGDRIVAFADHGVIVDGQMTEGELTWQRTELSESAPNFIDSTQCADGSVYALSFQNELWSAADGKWQNTAVPTEEQLQSVACDAQNTLWVSGAFSTLMSSADQGASWQDFSMYEDFTLTGLAFGDAQTGYAVGEFGSLVKTEDGGESWNMLDPITDDFYPLAVHFTSANEGWVSGVLGIVFHTEDGGATWQLQDTETVASIYGFVTDETAVYAFGDLGALLRYDASSGRWVDLPSPEIPVHYAAAVPVPNGLFLVGGWGVAFEVPVSPAQAAPVDGGAF